MENRKMTLMDRLQRSWWWLTCHCGSLPTHCQAIDAYGLGISGSVADERDTTPPEPSMTASAIWFD